jgi:hypothetical protein
MSGRLQLETSLLGDQGDDPRDRRIAELETELRQARREANDASLDAARAREDTTRALSMLRGQLGPLYRALQAVFGELDAVGVPESTSGPSPHQGEAVPGRVSAVWEAWKQKLPPACGRIIDTLMIHKDLSRQQLKVAAQMGESTMDGGLLKLNKAGLLSKANGRYQLKQL